MLVFVVEVLSTWAVRSTTESHCREMLLPRRKLPGLGAPPRCFFRVAHRRLALVRRAQRGCVGRRNRSGSHVS